MMGGCARVKIADSSDQNNSRGYANHDNNMAMVFVLFAGSQPGVR
jgi:hypothetical protein